VCVCVDKPTLKRISPKYKKKNHKANGTVQLLFLYNFLPLNIKYESAVFMYNIYMYVRMGAQVVV